MTANRSRGSLFKSLFSNLSVELPRIRPKPSRKDTSEGLIAPRSPLLPRSPTVYRTPSGASGTRTPPPRSPGYQTHVNGLDTHLSPGTFKLTTPPKRVSFQARKIAAEGNGLGLRKSSLGSEDGDAFR